MIVFLHDKPPSGVVSGIPKAVSFCSLSNVDVQLKFFTASAPSWFLSTSLSASLTFFGRAYQGLRSRNNTTL